MGEIKTSLRVENHQTDENSPVVLRADDPDVVVGIGRKDSES